MDKILKDPSLFQKMTYGNPIIKTPYGKRHLVYADYTASGQLFKPIEKFLETNIYPYYANTHSNAYSGRLMSQYIDLSKKKIRTSVNAKDTDQIIFTGHGCSAAVKHFIHILNVCECKGVNKPIVLITDFEHNSNFLPWKYINVDLEIVPTIENNECSTISNGLIDLIKYEELLKKYKDRCFKVVSFSAGSNITGIVQNVNEICKLAHKYNFIIGLDYAAIGPYEKINMHYNDSNGEYIDAIFLSPHKFLGGPGAPGLLIANKTLFKNTCPFYPSGGTVSFSSSDINLFSQNIEVKETGGTPNIIGCIKTGLVFQLKDMLIDYIIEREEKIVFSIRTKLNKIKNLHLLNPVCAVKVKQIPIFSFIITDLHYNFVVVLLNDLFGIQSRGGTSCSGIYAEKLLKINEQHKKEIVNSIISNKGIPKDYGWTRVTFHYTNSDYVINYILAAVEFVALYGQHFLDEYEYIQQKNIWMHKKCHIDLNINLNIDLKIDLDPKIDQVKVCNNNYFTVDLAAKYLRKAYKILKHKLIKSPA